MIITRDSFLFLPNVTSLVIAVDIVPSPLHRFSSVLVEKKIIPGWLEPRSSLEGKKSFHRVTS